MKNISSLVNNKSFIKKVQYILIGLFLIIIGLDVYLSLDSQDGNTISNVIQDQTDNGLFVLTYFWGTLAANLFFTSKKPKLVSSAVGTIIVIVIALLILFFNIEPKLNLFFTNNQYDFSIYTISMVLGFIIGLLFWRQEDLKTTHND